MADWKVEFTLQALRDLEGLETSVARRILSKLSLVAKNPSRFFERLAGSDLHKLRIGDYRILAVLSPSTRVVIVQRIGHRSKVYDR